VSDASQERGGAFGGFVLTVEEAHHEERSGVEEPGIIREY
jgi:hypothetical protein